MEKILKIRFSNGELFTVPARIIAENRAEYYSSIDGYDKGSNEWEAEVQNALNDEFILQDWIGNDMDWSDIEPYVQKLDDEEFDYEDEWSEAEIEMYK